MNTKIIIFLFGTTFVNVGIHAMQMHGIPLKVQEEEKLSSNSIQEVNKIIKTGQPFTKTFYTYEKGEHLEKNFKLFNGGYTQLFKMIYENNQDEYKNRKQPTLEDPLVDTKKLSAVNLLYECPNKECPLNSFDESGIRRVFEVLIIQELSKISELKSKKLVYASIGSEELFEDFVILSQLLDAGYDIGKIIIIDNDEYYQNFVKEQKVYYDSLYQFSRWFLTRIPNIEIIVYDDILKYFEDCEIHKNLKCDVMTMLDLTKDDEAWVLKTLCTKFDFKIENHIDGILCFLSKNLTATDTFRYVVNPDLKALCYKGNCGTILSKFTWK